MTALPFTYSSHDYPGPVRRRPIVLGAGILLLHLALLYGWRHVQPPPLPDSGPKVESITVWIRPPTPIIKPLPPPPPVARIEPKREKKPVRAAASPGLKVPATPVSEAVPNAITVAPSPTPADPLANEAPKFDMDAALKPRARWPANATRPRWARRSARSRTSRCARKPSWRAISPVASAATAAPLMRAPDCWRPW